MGRKWGTIPGWAYSDDYSKDNKVYIGTPSSIRIYPKGVVEINKLHKYTVIFDITFYFYDSPPDTPEVTRIIKGQKITQFFKDKYPGGLDKWVDDIINDYANRGWEDTRVELAGLTSKDDEDYEIEIIDKQYKQPIEPSKIEIPEPIKPEVVEPTKVIEPVKPKFVEPIPTIKVPTYIVDQINMLEKLATDYERKAEKLRKEVQNIKEKYGIK